MKRRLSIAELIRQDVLDLDPEPPRPPCLIAPRLLILACSATKAEGEGLVARDRYQGPLWQTLRAADPDGVRAFACFVSGRFGLGDARDLLPHYDRVLTDADADRMCLAGPWACYPELPQNGRMTMAEVPGSGFQLKADLVLLAMGFVGPRKAGMLEQSGVTLDPRGNIAANVKDYRTSVPKLYAAGDMRRGQSLVVWAIREGRQCARSIDEMLMGSSTLPR